MTKGAWRAYLPQRRACTHLGADCLRNLTRATMSG